MYVQYIDKPSLHTLSTIRICKHEPNPTFSNFSEKASVFWTVAAAPMRFSRSAPGEGWRDAAMQCGGAAAAAAPMQRRVKKPNLHLACSLFSPLFSSSPGIQFKLRG